jgi:hypothetical protein
MDSRALSEKSKPFLLFNFKFRKCTETKNSIKLRCTVKSCLSNLISDKSGTVLKISNFNHNHETSENINRQVVANSLKGKATEQVTIRLLKLIRNEVR